MRISTATTAVALLFSQLVLCQDNAAASILKSALATVTVPYSHFTDAASHSATSTLATSTKPTTTAVPFEAPVAAKPMCDYVFSALNQIGGGSKRTRRRRAEGGGRGGGGGGGEPGVGSSAGSQSPIDNYFFDFAVKEGKKQRYDRSLPSLDSGGEFAFTVGRADYKGNHNMFATADYNWGGIGWYKCSISFDGGPYIAGKVDGHVSPGYVSEVTSTCTVTHVC